jgi:hypothetical protein
MKFDELRSIAHNIAHSLASGFSMLIGVYDVDVFAAARRSEERFIDIDFLTGMTSGGALPSSFVRDISLCKAGLAKLCAKHGTTPTVFRTLSARYSANTFNQRVVVTVEDTRGRRAVDEYVDVPLRRIRVLDHLGRVRRKK